MRLFLFALILSLGFCGAVGAQPTDPRPFVADARGGGQPRLDIRQTALCFTYRTPVYTVDLAARTVRIDQRADGEGCGVPPPDITGSYDIPGAFPIGTYTWVYQLVAPGYPPVPSSSGTFTVFPAEQGDLTVNPLFPIALEPVRLAVSVVPVCQRLDSVRPIEGGFRVVKVRRISDCGGNPVVQDVTLGAFAPGIYRIEVGVLTPEGFTVEQQGSVIVRPSLTSETIESEAKVDVDLSGLWYSPIDAPSTGMSLIHARKPRAQGSPSKDVITVLWYLYDGAGVPVWYVIVAEDDANGTRTGPVLVFNGAGAQIGSNPVGTATLSFDAGSATGRVRAQVGNRTFDFRIERFRWPIRAWPTAPNFFPPS